MKNPIFRWSVTRHQESKEEPGVR